MSQNFPGHYTPITARSCKTSSNLIDMSQKAESVSDFDNADVPLSATLVTSPNSPLSRLSRTKPLDEESDEGGRVDEPEIVREASPTPPPRTPTPAYLHHPRYFYEDGTVFILVRMFRIYARQALNQNRSMIVSSVFTHITSSTTMEISSSIGLMTLWSPNAILSSYPRKSRFLRLRIS